MNDDSNAECDALLASISAYLDGELDALACQTIEQHCRDCARCRAVVEGFRKTIGLCREAGSTPLPESVRQLARTSIKRLLADKERAT